MKDLMRVTTVPVILGLVAFAMSEPQSREPLRLAPAVAQLVVVDVFVTDNRGHPVSSLLASDFDLLDDHKTVEIVGFEPPRTRPLSRTRVPIPAPGGGIVATASTPDAEVMVIFMDRKLLSPGGRSRAIQQAQALASEHIKAGGRVVVIAEDGALRPLSAVTDSRSEVERALGRIGELAIQSPGADHERIVLSQFEAVIEMHGCISGLPQLINAVRDYARWRAIEVQEARDRLNGLVDALVGLPGRKALVYASEGLEQRPGIHLFEQITSICPEVLAGESTQVFAAMQEMETSPALKEVAARANAARVTLYPLDARGLMTATGIDVSRGDRRYVPTAKNDFIRDASMTNSYQILAEETGGFPMVRGLSPAVAVKRLRGEAAGHYLLAFTPARDPDGRAHDLTLRLAKERRDVQIRYRRSYLHAEPAVQRGQRALSALMFGLEENSLGAGLDIERGASAEKNPSSAIVRIVLRIDTLRFEATDGGRTARVRVVVALRSQAEGGLRPPTVIREREFTIGLPSPESPQASREVVIAVPINEAGHDFAVGIEDVASGVATYLRRSIGPGQGRKSPG